VLSAVGRADEPPASIQMPPRRIHLIAAARRGIEAIGGNVLLIRKARWTGVRRRRRTGERVGAKGEGLAVVGGNVDGGRTAAHRPFGKPPGGGGGPGGHPRRSTTRIRRYSETSVRRRSTRRSRTLARQRCSGRWWRRRFPARWRHDCQ